MKPIRLTISGFGAFAKEMTVDFNVLSKDGVFLITGQTGSGKTTLFDAICYALYGKANGQDRDIKNFRSHFATSNQKTHVRLLFECNGKRYEIIRNLEYYDNKKLAQRIEFTLPNGSILKKEREVASKIKEILGLDCEQFRQIVMIAQGEFKRFLLSKGDDKGKILNTVFGTQRYVNLIENLNIVKERYREQYLEVMNEVVNDLLSIRYDDSWDYHQKFERWKNTKLEDKDVKEVLTNLDMYIKILWNDIIQLSGDLYVLESMVKRLTNEISKYEEVNRDIEARNRLRENLEQLNSQRKEIDSIRTILKRIDIAKSIEIAYLDYIRSVDSVSQIKTKLEKLQKSINEYNIKVESLNAQKLRLCISFFNDDVNDVGIELERLKNNIMNKRSDLSLQGKRLNNILDNTIDRYTQLASTLKLHRIELINMSNRKADLERQYIEYERIYNLNIAGILAEQLQEGKPCMVCGSVHHPNIATKQIDTISKGQLDILRNELDNYQDKYRRYQTNFLIEEQECLNLESKIVEQSSELGLSVNDVNSAKTCLLDLRTTLRKEYKDLGIQLSMIDNTIDRLRSIEDNLTTYQNQSIALDATKKNLVEQLKVAITESESLRDSYYKLLEDNNITSEQEHIDLLNRYKEYTYLKSKVDSFDSSISDYNSRIDEYSKTIGERLTVDTSELRKELSRFQKLYQDGIKRYSVVAHTLSSNSAIYDRVSECVDTLSERYCKYKDAEYLYKIASGKITGGIQKVAFDNYVQAYYFERVIESANVAMQTMSNGRYLLVRSETTRSKSERAGLDINVLDSYTGMVRAVSTLSGGETFMASLSLALGLSDVVQRLSGGIKIDAMFIDEGFGTLDSDQSLQQALKVIDDLVTDNRIVGIISHVSELREHITNQLHVIKSIDGSTLYTN